MDFDLSRLMNDLQAGDTAVRERAAECLAEGGESVAGAAVPLVRACADESEVVREWCVAALEGCGPPHVEDLPALCELLRSSDADIGYWAATLLGRLEAAAAPAAEALALTLTAGAGMAVRERAAWALQKIGPAAAAALPALRAAATANEPRLARLARAAVERIAGVDYTLRGEQ